MCSIEKEDPKLQLSRISSSHTLFKHDLFKQRETEFHSQFILNFGKSLPANFAWTYLNFYKTANDKNLSFNGADNENIGLKMLQSFRERSNSKNFNVELFSKNFDYVFNESGLRKEFEVVDLFEPDRKEYHLEGLAISICLDVRKFKFLK